ncbi:MAG: hypothetical protein WC556_13620 [Candidatus Methanoperedens sp.]
MKRLTLEHLALPNPRTFELIDGKYECAGSSRIEALEECIKDFGSRLQSRSCMTMNMGLR